MKHDNLNNIHKQRKKGWRINLYRNKKKGYLGGVCAGLAEHFEVDTWVVRLITLGGLLFLGSFTLIAYLILWWLLSPRPSSNAYEYEYDEQHHGYRPKKMFKYADSASVRLRRARQRLQNVTQRVSDMEYHVTSKQFDLEQEFSKLRD